MGLRKYREMRDFGITPEPSGGSARAGRALSFTIQRHAARRLHYDFRLEMNGVLVSWAVPMGPSLDPSEKRLAVHVEDHPIEYGTFEGRIPAGQYGAGEVVLWDRGTWVPDADPLKGVRDGRLKFELRGEKLTGRWMLVRMGGRAAREGKENWLLMKERDDVARADGDILVERPESVKRARRRARPRLEGARRAPMPRVSEPQLAVLVDEVPRGGDWIQEIKFDGYRLLATVADGRVTLTTRGGLDWTERFPAVASALSKVRAKGALIDGEAVVLDAKGLSDFQALQNALSEGSKSEIVYYAFDLLYLDGLDLRPVPLRERKAALGDLLGRATDGVLRFSDHVEGSGAEFFTRACEAGLEGILCKRADAPHRPGRHSDWVKVKCLQNEEFVVGGWTDPEGTRSGFGALLLGRHENGRLAYAGKVGTGFTEASLRQLHMRLRRLARDASPFDPKPPGRAHWVEPQLVAQVAYHGWTRDRVLRQARFLGLREDKPAEEVVPEKTRRIAKAAGGAVADIVISNPDREVYPGTGVTKRHVAEYYEAVADWMLPHVADRPLSLVRCPEGLRKPCFYQKHFNDKRPDALRAVRIREKSGADEYAYLRDAAGLVSLVQMGVLEIHPWGSRVKDIERPDVITFDLDPAPDVAWERVVRTAHALRERLEELGLRSFAKTTGGKGLHVVAPITPELEWDDVKAYTKVIAEEFVTRAPSEYIATMSKAARKGRIFIDYLRNGRGATAVAAYSTRARPDATVATPLTWKELTPSLAPAEFTIARVRERLRRLRSDPWDGFAKVRQRIQPGLS